MPMQERRRVIWHMPVGAPRGPQSEDRASQGPQTTDRAEMTDKTRITIAVLITMLLLGAMSVAGALTHTGTHVVAATSKAPSAAVSAPHAVPVQTTDQNND